MLGQDVKQWNHGHHETIAKDQLRGDGDEKREAPEDQFCGSHNWMTREKRKDLQMKQSED